MNIAVLGYGTVGLGVVEVLTTNRETITKRAGEAIDVKYVLDLRDFREIRSREKIVHDYQVILDDPEIKIIVEVMGALNRLTLLSRRLYRQERVYQLPTRNW